MKFSIACSWDQQLVDRLVSLQESTGNTFELFGGMRQSILGSGHSAISVRGKCSTRKEVEAFSTYARERGIRLNYTLNAACLGNLEFTREGRKAIIEHILWVSKIADAVTVAIPLLIELIKDRFDLEVVVSTIAAVDSVRQFQFYEKLGADRIVLDIRINRDFEMLRNIKQVAKSEVEIMVNNGCLFECPYHYYHYNIGSHASQEGDAFYLDYCVQKCFHHRMTEPAEYIKIPWIRPEDLQHYTSLASWFKIAGREMSTPWIINCTEAYTSQQYQGNLLDLMTMVLPSSNEFAKIMLPPPPSIHIDNQRLDGFLDHWLNGARCVSCENCRYCENTAKNLVQVDDEKMKKYQERFDSFLPLTLNIDRGENKVQYKMVRTAYQAYLHYMGLKKNRSFHSIAEIIKKKIRRSN